MTALHSMIENAALELRLADGSLAQVNENQKAEKKVYLQMALQHVRLASQQITTLADKLKEEIFR